MHLCFDWDGTIVRKEVAEEAALRRGKTLCLSMDAKWMREAQKTHAHYAVFKKAISAYTGVKDEHMLTIMMTELFRFHYLAVVHEWKHKIFYPCMVRLLKDLHAQGHTLSIASTLRQDILDYALKDRGLAGLFAVVKANTPELRYAKVDLVRQVVRSAGKIHWMVGDREEDIEAGRRVGAQGAFVHWGAGESRSGQGEKDKHARAWHVARHPRELRDLFK